MNQNTILTKIARPCGVALVSFMIIFALISFTGAAAELVVSPGQNEYQGNVGDTIVLEGKVSDMSLASDSTEVQAAASYTATVPVVNGSYEYQLDDVKVPADSDSFTVEAEKVNDLEVRVELPSFLSVLSSYVPSITAQANAQNVASVTQSNVPPAKYDIIISGQSDADEVDITMKGLSTIETKNGKFSTSYETDSVPAGKFTVEVGDEKYQITLSDESPAPVQETKAKKSSSHTGTELKIIPADEDASVTDSIEETEETEQEDVLESPADEEQEPEQNITQQTPAEPQTTFFQKLIAWLNSLFG